MKQHIVCFELNIVEKYDVLKGAFSKRVETKATFTLKSSCLGGKKNEREKGGRISGTLYGCRYECKLKESEERVFVFNGHGLHTTQPF